MTATKINRNIFSDAYAFLNFTLQRFAFLPVCTLIFLLSSFAVAQELPDKIRGYKVYDAQISVETTGEMSPKTKSAARVKVGEPELSEISLSGITFELSAEVFDLEQSGTVDFLTFHDFRVNDLPVEIEDYTESFIFKKNQPVKLPKPARISIGATQALRGAMREAKESKSEWNVSGRVFVFGRFKKFGLTFKRVVPVQINIKIKNPLKQIKTSSI